MFKIVNSRKSDNTLINPHVTHTAKTLESALRWANVDDPDHYDEDTADIILSRISPA